MIPKYREALQESLSKAHQIREVMPWITEQEQEDLVKKIEETRDWLDNKMEEQDKLELTEDPSFNVEDFEKEMGKMTKLAKKIFGKKKPKEKKPKKEEVKEEVKDEEAKTDADDETTTTWDSDKAETQSEETADATTEEL